MNAASIEASSGPVPASVELLPPGAPALRRFLRGRDGKHHPAADAPTVFGVIFRHGNKNVVGLVVCAFLLGLMLPWTIVLARAAFDLFEASGDGAGRWVLLIVNGAVALAFWALPVALFSTTVWVFDAEGLRYHFLLCGVIVKRRDIPREDVRGVRIDPYTIHFKGGTRSLTRVWLFSATGLQKVFDGLPDEAQWMADLLTAWAGPAAA